MTSPSSAVRAAPTHRSRVRGNQGEPPPHTRTGTGTGRLLMRASPPAAAPLCAVPVVSYTTMQWEWDEAKFQMKTPLRELSESISLRISGLDDELKIKVTEMNTLRGALQALERKTQGNLMVRGLADIVAPDDVIESEYMTTTFVVVPKATMKEFEGSYHKMATYVVPVRADSPARRLARAPTRPRADSPAPLPPPPLTPSFSRTCRVRRSSQRSCKLLSEDAEYGLYSVILFRKSLDEFKASAREKRLTLREFSYDPGAAENERAKKAQDEREFERLKSMLSNWCQVNYAEVYIMMLHLKAVRVFVESVLRYGLTNNFNSGMVPNFKAYLLQPKKGKGEQLRKVLAGLYGGGLGGGGEAEEEMVIPGATGEFYPYVYTPIETEPNIAT